MKYCKIQKLFHTFTNDDVWDWLQRQIRRYQDDGFGLWEIISKETGEMIGQAELIMQNYQDQKVLEIGYLVKKRYWH